jgi:hypothetical protein
MATVQSTDTTSHPVFAIAKLDNGRTVKYPKVRPTGSSDANDAAWQTRMTTELNNALSATQTAGANSAQLLTSLV